MTPQQLARIVLNASKIHEESWNKEELEHETTTVEAIQKALQEEGLSELFWYPLDLAYYWMNDLKEWAEKVEAGMTHSREMFSDPDEDPDEGPVEEDNDG